MSDPHRNWKYSNGDETYALEWAIDERSMVWEIGGFEGRWAEQIVGRYDPYMRIFEPTKWGYGKCSALFFDNDKVEVEHYGLWVMDAHLPLYNPGNDGASLLGAMVGGAVEYLALITGYQALLIVVAAIYVSAWLAATRLRVLADKDLVRDGEPRAEGGPAPEPAA